MCLLCNREGWRPDDGKLIRVVTDGDVWVEPECFRPLSVTLLTALLKCSFQNNTLIPKSPPCSCSLNTYLLLKSYPGFVSQSINAPIRKRSASKPISKRGSAIFFSATSSHALIFLFNPVTCYFLSSQQFEIEYSQTFCIDRNNKSLYSDWVQPSTSDISLFWQFVELTSAKELNSAEVTQFCRVAPRVLKVSLFKKTFCLWPCLKVTVNLRKRKPHTI